MLRTIVNVDPNREFRAIEDMFERMFGQPSRPVSGAATLPIDIIERDGALLVKAAVPGVDPANLDVTIENNVLSIRGESAQEQAGENDKIYRREVAYGAFSRSIRLPENLDFEAVSADFSHGMVTVTLPRLPEAKPKALKVEVKTSGEAKPALEQPAE
jgi:HSP20 family protein